MRFFVPQIKFDKSITICHQDIQCMTNKILDLDIAFTGKNNCDFLLISEH